MKRIMVVAGVLVGLAIGVAALAKLPEPGSQIQKSIPQVNLGVVNCIQHPILFSSTATNYGVSVVEGTGSYTVHWWGKLSCGTYDSLAALGDPVSFGGGNFNAGGKLFPVFVSSQLPATLKVQEVQVCEGLAKDKTVVHCKNVVVDNIDMTGLKMFMQTLKSIAQKFTFYGVTKAQPVSPLDFATSPEVALPTLLEQGKALDGDNDGVYTKFDNCPTVFNPSQDDACPAVLGEPPQDSDGDGVPNGTDTCEGQGEAGKVDAQGCPLPDGSGTVTPPTETGASNTTTVTDTTSSNGVNSDSGGFCALLPTAAPNAGWLLVLVGMIPLVVRRRR